MTVLSESIGTYTQTIRLHNDNTSEVVIRKDGVELFNGQAKHIIDTGNKISFKDINGKSYEIQKYESFYLS